VKYTTGVETLERLFFEQPAAVYLAIAAIEVVLFAIWLARQNLRRSLMLLIGPGLITIVALTAHFVKTDREQIEAILQEIGTGIKQSDLSAAVKYLDDACTVPVRPGRKLSKDAIIRIGRRVLKRRQVARLISTFKRTEIHDDSATTRINVRVVLTSGEYVNTRWRFEWIRRQIGWRIIRVELLYPPELTRWNF